MKKGMWVTYVCHFDADPTDTIPNECPALITKVNPTGTLDLTVFFQNGFFCKMSTPQGGAGQRGTWYVAA